MFIQSLTFRGWDVRLRNERLASADARIFTGSIDLLDDQELAPRPIPAMESLRATVLLGQESKSGKDPPATTVNSIAWPWVTHTAFWGYERAIQWLAAVDSRW
jgi:hypothetical protein